MSQTTFRAAADAAAFPARNWVKVLKKYTEPDISRSVFELVVTAAPLAVFFGAALWAASISLWLAIPFQVIAAGFLVRLFLIQHDCCHGAFFRNAAVNDAVGRVIGAFTLTPYDLWKRSHLEHHKTHGNLDCRGVGDVYTLTVEEYNALSPLGRFGYKLYRHPIVLFGLGPAFVFLLHHRLPIGFMRAGPRYWISTMATNVAVAGIVAAGGFAFGWGLFLFVYLGVACLAAMIGVWLFYVQHQFETTVWDKDPNWRLHDAALYGSSHYDLPAVLRWMTANIGIHHVHHLYSRIPFYRLPTVLREHPPLAKIQRMTMLDSLKTVRLKLWDAEARRLVPYAVARARRVTA